MRDFSPKIEAFENRIGEYLDIFEKRKRRKPQFAGKKMIIEWSLNHPDRGLVKIEQFIGFPALLHIELTQRNNLANGFDIKARALGLGEDFFFIIRERFDLFLERFHPLDKRAQTLTGNTADIFWLFMGMGNGKIIGHPRALLKNWNDTYRRIVKERERL